MIIAHSITIKEGGCLPRRIVIRESERSFVVHTQLFENGGASSSFVEGYYFAKTNNSGMAPEVVIELARNKAWVCFEKRSRKLLGLDVPDNVLADEIANAAAVVIRAGLRMADSKDEEYFWDYGRLRESIDRFEDLTGIDCNSKDE